MTVLVSCLLPVFNEDPKILNEILQSIANQSFKNFELIIIDESTEIDVKRVIDEFHLMDERIKILRPTNKLGLVKSLNLGLKYATGLFIARADSDDPLKINRFKTQVDFLNHNPDIDVLGCSIELINKSGVLIGLRNYPKWNKDIILSSAIRNPISHASVMMRSNVIKSIGGYDERFKRSEDYELWLRLIRVGAVFHNIESPLIQHRVADEFRRDRLNWYFNLLAKVRYFKADNIIKRLIGITISLVFLITPSIFHKYFYNYYNHRKLFV